MPDLHGARMLGDPAPAAPGAPAGAPEPSIHPELADRWHALGAARTANGELLVQLSRMGIGIDPMSLLNARLVAMLETMFPGETVEGQGKQIEVELRYEDMLSGFLAEARRKAVSAQLAAGARVPPEMLEQMARATGQAVPPRGFQKGSRR